MNFRYRKGKTEDKEVFIRRIQKRGTGNSVSVPWVKKNNGTWESAKNRIYSGLTRMRSDRARCKSWRWFSGSYFSKLIPKSSEFPVPLFWKAHPKTLGLPFFRSSVRKFPSQILIRQKQRGALTAETAGDPGSSDALDPGSCSRNSSGFFLFYEIRNCRGYCWLDVRRKQRDTADWMQLLEMRDVCFWWLWSRY